jgi:hypothetical protein
MVLWDAGRADFTFGGNITVSNVQVTDFASRVGGLNVHYEGVDASVVVQTRLELGRFGLEFSGQERGYAERPRFPGFP